MGPRPYRPGGASPGQCRLRARVQRQWRARLRHRLRYQRCARGVRRPHRRRLRRRGWRCGPRGLRWPWHACGGHDSGDDRRRGAGRDRPRRALPRMRRVGHQRYCGGRPRVGCLARGVAQGGGHEPWRRLQSCGERSGCQPRRGGGGGGGGRGQRRWGRVRPLPRVHPRGHHCGRHERLGPGRRLQRRGRVRGRARAWGGGAERLHRLRHRHRHAERHVHGLPARGGRGGAGLAGAWRRGESRESPCGHDGWGP
mmetsp:Transcript_26499/g.77934  ORF Transcript_26499/g.77934 Transcript_26499/m.77934 type:complete len:254 (-) Transcript_26499:558-1319(-)